MKNKILYKVTDSPTPQGSNGHSDLVDKEFCNDSIIGLTFKHSELMLSNSRDFALIFKENFVKY